MDSFGSWLRRPLEPLGDRYRGRKPVTLEFDREDIAMRILFEVGPEAEIVKPVEPAAQAPQPGREDRRRNCRELISRYRFRYRYGRVYMPRAANLYL